MKTSIGHHDHCSASDVAEALAAEARKMDGPHGSSVAALDVNVSFSGFTLRTADGREYEVVVALKGEGS